MDAQPAPAIIELIQAPRVTLSPFEPCEGTPTQWYQIFEEACATSRVRPEPVQDGAIVRATNAKRAYFLSSIGRRAYAVLE